MSENRFREPIYPYQNVAVVGVEKSIAFSLSDIEEGEKEVTRFGEKIHERMDDYFYSENLLRRTTEHQYGRFS